MKIGFVGLGKLGLPIALAIEAKGHEVVGCDVTGAPREMLRARKLAYREEVADELLQNTRIEQVSMQEVVRRSDLIFVTIQTPHDPQFEGITRIPNETRDFDYTFLKKGVAELSGIVEELGQDKIVIIISTVLPGTIRRDIKPLLGKHSKLCYNPFFIAMGRAIRDFLSPEFVLFGVDDDRAAKMAEEFYRTIHNAPFRRTTVEEAEVVKVLYNTMISTKIAFANTAMEICHHTPNANVDVVLSVLGDAKDRLISTKYFGAGMGDGGGCHPRDNIALSHLSKELNLSHDWFANVMQQRERQTDWLAGLCIENARGRDIVILGKTFKPETNLVTGSPAVLLENILREKGAKVVSWDPYVDVGVPAPTGKAFCYFIGTKHPDFREYPYERGSVVLDPWRYVTVREADNVELIPIGKGVEKRTAVAPSSYAVG